MSAGSDTLERSLAAPTAVRRVLRGLAEVVQDEVPATLEGRDPEHLHDLRIAVRRTRTMLRELDDVLPLDAVAPHKQLFRHLADATSEPRDLDVHLYDWEDHLRDLPDDARAALAPVRLELEWRRDAAHRELTRVLESPATTNGLAAWTTWLEEPVADGDVTIAGLVSKRVAKLHKRLLHDGRQVTPDSPGEQLHELRKLGKRLRYLVECFPDVFGAKPRKAYLAQLKALQDNLGAHQDAEVQVSYLRGLARQLNDGSPQGTDLVLAIGRLSEQADERRGTERRAFAERFETFDRDKTTKVLTALLASTR
jgi:CHAD domain-containing protein